MGFLCRITLLIMIKSENTQDKRAKISPLLNLQLNLVNAALNIRYSVY
jgi:hypothetical protein